MNFGHYVRKYGHWCLIPFCARIRIGPFKLCVMLVASNFFCILSCTLTRQSLQLLDIFVQTVLVCVYCLISKAACLTDLQPARWGRGNQLMIHFRNSDVCLRLGCLTRHQCTQDFTLLTPRFE